jgi:hypothetical protein
MDAISGLRRTGGTTIEQVAQVGRLIIGKVLLGDRG